MLFVLFLLCLLHRYSLVSAVFDCIASLNDVAPMFPMLLSVDLREWKSDFVDEYIFYLQETVKVFFFAGVPADSASSS